MKMILLLAFAVVLGAVVARPQQDARIVQESNNFNGIDPWTWSFLTSNGISREESGSVVGDDLEVRGVYKWTAPDGTTYTVEYTAGTNGYQAKTSTAGGLGVNTQLSLIG